MVYLRADANSNLGMGHIMRCLSIADAFHRLGCDPVFILADESAAGLVADRGFRAVVLGSDYTDLTAELPCWPQEKADLILVDSYYVTAVYLHHLKSALKPGGKMVILDDVAAFPYPVDVLVNYNAYGPYLDYARLYQASGEQTPRLLLGPAYAPLRAMFRAVPKKKQALHADRILISTGGSDPLHLALSIVKILAGRPGNMTYHILIGALNADREQIRTLSANQPHIILHENVSDMRRLFASVDVAVSAAGSTLYEICACGVPLITYVLADNQFFGAEAFEKSGLAVNLGDLRAEKTATEKILCAAETLCRDYEKRVETGRRMQALIDGCGADRLAQALLEQEMPC